MGTSEVIRTASMNSWCLVRSFGAGQVMGSATVSTMPDWGAGFPIAADEGHLTIITAACWDGSVSLVNVDSARVSYRTEGDLHLLVAWVVGEYEEPILDFTGVTRGGWSSNTLLMVDPNASDTWSWIGIASQDVLQGHSGDATPVGNPISSPVLDNASPMPQPCVAVLVTQCLGSVYPNITPSDGYQVAAGGSDTFIDEWLASGGANLGAGIGPGVNGYGFQFFRVFDGGDPNADMTISSSPSFPDASVDFIQQSMLFTASWAPGCAATADEPTCVGFLNAGGRGGGDCVDEVDIDPAHDGRFVDAGDEYDAFYSGSDAPLETFTLDLPAHAVGQLLVMSVGCHRYGNDLVGWGDNMALSAPLGWTEIHDVWHKQPYSNSPPPPAVSPNPDDYRHAAWYKFAGPGEVDPMIGFTWDDGAVQVRGGITCWSGIPNVAPSSTTTTRPFEPTEPPYDSPPVSVNWTPASLNVSNPAGVAIAVDSGSGATVGPDYSVGVTHDPWLGGWVVVNPSGTGLGIEHSARVGSSNGLTRAIARRSAWTTSVLVFE